MVRLGITGGDATALVAGTALILMAVITIANHGLRTALEVSADHLRDGFIFAIKIFAPVIVIAGFFFLGSESFAQTVLGTDATGLLNDIGLWLAEHVPMSRASVALLENRSRHHYRIGRLGLLRSAAVRRTGPNLCRHRLD